MNVEIFVNTAWGCSFALSLVLGFSCGLLFWLKVLK